MVVFLPRNFCFSHAEVNSGPKAQRPDDSAFMLREFGLWHQIAQTEPARIVEAEQPFAPVRKMENNMIVLGVRRAIILAEDQPTRHAKMDH